MDNLSFSTEEYQHRYWLFFAFLDEIVEAGISLLVQLHYVTPYRFLAVEYNFLILCINSQGTLEDDFDHRKGTRKLESERVKLCVEVGIVL